MISQWALVSMTALFFGFYNIFARAAGPKIGGVLGPLLLEGFAAVLLLVFFLWRKYQGIIETGTSSGIIYSLAGGLCAALGSITFFTVFSRGGQLSQAGSWVFVGSALFAVIGGFSIFKEPINPSRLIGIILGLVSLFLLRLE